MVKVMYNDKIVYKVIIWVFYLGLFMKREGSFKRTNNDRHILHAYTTPGWIKTIGRQVFILICSYSCTFKRKYLNVSVGLFLLLFTNIFDIYSLQQKYFTVNIFHIKNSVCMNDNYKIYRTSVSIGLCATLI